MRQDDLRSFHPLSLFKYNVPDIKRKVKQGLKIIPILSYKLIQFCCTLLDTLLYELLRRHQSTLSSTLRHSPIVPKMVQLFPTIFSTLILLTWPSYLTGASITLEDKLQQLTENYVSCSYLRFLYK